MRKDKESLPVKMNVKMATGNSLPSFIEFIDGTINISPTLISHVGTY